MDYVDVLCRLIEFDTSAADGTGCREAMAYLATQFGKVGCDVARVEIPRDAADGLDGRMALLCHRRRAKAERLLVYSHVDVVPAQGWSAFTPRVAGGRVYGRGAADMKGSIAALLGALWRLRGRELRYAVSALVTMDEETHQMSQLRYLTPFLEPGTRPHVLSLDNAFGYVTIANLGLLQLDIVVHGVSVHSGLAHLGRNAVEGAARLVSAVLALKERVLERRSSVETHPDTGLLLMEPRLNLNWIEGGLARNIVPDLCRFSIDRRLLPEESAEAAREELLAALRGGPGVEWEVVREYVIPTVPCCDDPAAGVMAGVIREVTGVTGLYGAMMSGELPGAACGPWGGQSFGVGLIRPDNHIHGVDEHVCVADLDRLTEVLARFLSGDRKEAA